MTTTTKVPTTGHVGLDHLTTALALHLFVDPSAADALATYWVATSVGGPRNVAPTVSFGIVLRRLARGTAKCELSLFLVPQQRSSSAPLEFEVIVSLFPMSPTRVRGGTEEPDAGLSLTARAMAEDPALTPALLVLTDLIEASARVSPPVMDDGARPFRIRDASGVQHDLWLRGFDGDDRLTAYVDRPLLLAAATRRMVEAIAALTRRPKRAAALSADRGIALMLTRLAGVHHELAADPGAAADVVKVCSELGAALQTHAYRTADALEAVKRVHAERAALARAKRDSIIQAE